MTLDAVIVLSETSNPKEVDKRVDEILILQINQWSNMTSLGIYRNEPGRRTNTQEPLTAPHTHFTTSTSLGHTVVNVRKPNVGDRTCRKSLI